MLLALGALLGLVAVCNLLGRGVTRLGLPDLIGFLTAGILFGAHGLGLIGIHRTDLLPAELWRGLGDLGLAALMVSAGLSMPTRLSGAAWREVLILSLAILACLVPAFLTAPLLMDAGADAKVGLSADSNLAYQGTLALAVAVTSVPFLTRILGNTGLLRTQFGSTVLSTACLVDLAVWSLYPLLVDIRNGHSSDVPALVGKPLLVIGFFGFVLAIAAARRRWGETGTRASRWLGRAFLPVTAASCLTAAIWLDVGIMIASLAFGIALSRTRLASAPPTGGKAPWILNWILVPLYFAMVGAGLDLDRDVAPGLILGFLAWSCLIKIPLVTAAAASFGAGMRGSLSYGLALNTRGGPGIVLGGLALHSDIIGETTFLALIIASLVTAAAAEAGLAWLKRAPARGEDRWLGAPPAPAQAKGSLPGGSP